MKKWANTLLVSILALQRCRCGTESFPEQCNYVILHSHYWHGGHFLYRLYDGENQTVRTTSAAPLLLVYDSTGVAWYCSRFGIHLLL